MSAEQIIGDDDAALEATIIEAGNGFPEVGDYVATDGDLYLIESMGPRIETAPAGVGNSVPGCRVTPADWDDVSEDDIYPADIAWVRRAPEGPERAAIDKAKGER